MGNKESKELLSQVASALQTGAAAISAYEELAERYKRALNDVAKLEESIKVMKNVNRNKDLLINSYKEATELRFQICSTCGGDGGFTYEGGPGEYDHQQCEHCDGKGVIKNETV